MNKKFLSLVLALVMVLGTFTSVFAADTTKTTDMPKLTSNDAKIQWLIDNKIVAGRTVNEDPNKTDLALNSTIQRAEITRLLVYATGEETLAQKMQGSKLIYPDVPATHWANGYIAVGSTVKSPSNQEHFIHGYEDGYFRPEKAVRYDELAKMLVVLAKKDLNLADAKIAGGRWSDQWMRWAAELGILDGINEKDYTKDAVRKDAFVMLYNALYKMGGVKDSRVLPGNQVLGIISENSNGTTLTLNQGDLKKEYKVDKNTVFVQDGTTQGRKWLDILQYGKNYYIGSLVRVLVDNNNTVTHIIELGNPVDLAINNTGWIGVADHQVETLPSGNAIYDANANTIDINLRKLHLNSSTRYFVADPDRDALTEVTKDVAKKLVVANPEKVYAGYNTLPTSGRNEAKVVVFNVVKDGFVAKENVRVVAPGNTSFYLTVENAGWNPTEARSLNTYYNRNVFPFNYNVERYDVIQLAKNATDYKDPRGLTKVIDFKADPVYEVVKVNTKKVDNLVTSPVGALETVVLRDKAGYEATFDIMGDADLFFGTQIKPGAKVQITFDDAAKNIINVLSVVPETTELKGNLPNGKDARLITVRFDAPIPTTRDADGYYTLVGYEIAKDGTKMGPNTYYTNDPAIGTLVAGNTYEVLAQPAHTGSRLNSQYLFRFNLVSSAPSTRSFDPVVASDPIPVGTTVLSGTGVPGATIKVTDAVGNSAGSVGTVAPVTVDASGNWSVTVPATVATQKIHFTQTEPGKTVSSGFDVEVR